MNRERPVAIFVTTLGFLLAILLANHLTTEYGLVDAGFGYVVTAGTFAAGVTFIFRDLVQELAGRLWVIAFIALGALLSWSLADGRIALASGVAFLLSELADYAIYTPLRERNITLAMLASNTVGAFVDTVLFLAIAGFPIWSSLPGQMYVKVGITLVFLLIWRGTVAVLRNPVQR